MFFDNKNYRKMKYKTFAKGVKSQNNESYNGIMYLKRYKWLVKAKNF